MKTLPHYLAALTLEVYYRLLAVTSKDL